MTQHPATVAKPWTDPTDWRDELDDIRRMLAEAGRSGPLRDEVAQLLVEVGRGDRIVLALQEEARRGLSLDPWRATRFMQAADVAKATQ